MNKLILGLVFFSFLISLPPVFGAEITFSNGGQTWYEYDCSSSAPSTWTQSNPRANVFKYLSYYFAGDCHAIMLTYNLEGLEDIANVTSVNVNLHTKSMLLTNQDLSEQYTVPCKLFIFGNPTITNGVISQTPSNYADFSCTGNSTSSTQIISIPYNVTEYTTLEDFIQAENLSYSIMIFPLFNSTMRTNLDNNSYEYAIGNFQNQLNIEGDGFSCVWIQASGMCNFYYDPWGAVKSALGQDYIGEWFYVLMFFPIPMAVFLSTRNGAYAGFTSLGIMLVIESIDRVVFEIALSMILISAGFGFYEIIRKRIFE